MRALAVLALLTVAEGAHAQAPPPAGFPGKPPPSPPVVIREFSAEAIATDAWTLRWDVVNAYSLTITPDIGGVATRGSRRVSPTVTTTYTLTATGPEMPTTRSVTVTIAGTAPAIVSTPAPGGLIPIPRLANGKTDLSGVYAADRNVRLVGEIRPVRGADAFGVTDAAERDTGTAEDCLPPGVPAVTMLPFPLQIVHTPDVVAFMYEAYHQFRIAPIIDEEDLGPLHADYLPPAWMGHSAAYWDGDTLVVDVSGFNDRTIIAGYRHTEELHVVERYTRSSRDTITYEASVADPNVFAEAVRYAGTLTLHPEWEIGEYVCAENNQDYDELFEKD